MSFSTGQFSQGHKDGLRDAKSAWSDHSGGWMWLWMMDEQYQRGYEQGWEDGRRAVKLENQQQELNEG